MSNDKPGPDLTKDPHEGAPTAPPAEPYGTAPGYGSSSYGAPEYGTPAYGAPAYGPPQQQTAPYGAGYPQQPPYGVGYPQPVASGKPDNNLVWAILSTVLCCWVLGIVSIVYAAKVDGLWNSGRYEEARDAAQKAKTWAIVNAAIGFVVAAIYILVILLGTAAETSIDEHHWESDTTYSYSS